MWAREWVYLCLIVIYHANQTEERTTFPIISFFFLISIIFKISTMDILFLESEIHIPIKEKEIESYRGLRMAWHCHLEGLGSCYYLSFSEN